MAGRVIVSIWGGTQPATYPLACGRRPLGRSISYPKAFYVREADCSASLIIIDNPVGTYDNVPHTDVPPHVLSNTPGSATRPLR